MEAFIKLISEKPKRGRPKKLQGGADALQKGKAAQLRSYVKGNKVKQKLNWIVHSGDADKVINEYGKNPYKDQSNTLDPSLDEVILAGEANIAAQTDPSLRLTEEEKQVLNKAKQTAETALKALAKATVKAETQSARAIAVAVEEPARKVKAPRPEPTKSLPAGFVFPPNINTDTKKRLWLRQKGYILPDELQGKGWLADKARAAKKAAQGAVRTVGATVLGKDRAERLERYGDAVLFLSNLPLPPSVKDVLRKHGDEPISKLVIIRNPVQKVLTGAMNAVSLGSFSKKFARLPYDDLFHLAIQVTTVSGVWSMEKNEVITFSQNPVAKQDAEYRPISLPSGITMNSLMTGSEKIQGKNFTRYDASNNNCQDFIMSLLKGSGLGNDADYTFVKQDTDTLFANDSFLRKLSRKLTNVGASVATAISGVDDKPIASTAAASQFEIPSPAVLDGSGAFGLPYPPAKKGRGRPRKACPHCGCSCCS
jgi:hypothetical protein